MSVKMGRTKKKSLRKKKLMGRTTALPLGNYDKIMVEIRDLILKKYGSVYKFCKIYELQESQMSRYLNFVTVPKANFLLHLLTILGYTKCS